MTDTRPLLILTGLSKAYGSNVVLNKFDLTIYDGEFFTLLGPSGCGKTTVLRMIAGLESADVGEIRLAGEEISQLPAEKRPVNTVFQSYALFPHMSVFDNVAFGLKMSGVAKDEIAPRVTEALEMVRLGEFANRKPAQLSGGQQQRVAIARALRSITSCVNKCNLNLNVCSANSASPLCMLPTIKKKRCLCLTAWW